LKPVTRALAAAQRLRHWSQHPHRITWLAAAVLLGATASAFGIAAVAPDAADLPVQQRLEALTPLDLSAQAQSLENHRFRLFRSEQVRSTDSTDSLLRRLGIDDEAASAYLRTDALVRQQVLGRAGRTVRAELDDSDKLQRLSVRWATDEDNRFKRLVLERTGAGFTSRLESAPLQASTRLSSGIIKTSLFAATDDARVPDAVAIQLAEIFAGDIDFHRALRKGDRFSVVYEALEADGEPLRVGKVLSAEFVSGSKTFQALWFQAPGINPANGNAYKGGYYTPDGQSLTRAYLASPLAFSRISSGFSMRLHPILQTWRAHLGVDYAAPTGTTVRAVGDGVVEFAGAQGGYGNVVILRHGNQHTTVYAHMSRLGVRKGQSVAQGQTIGLVGATGWATGPHLHFEFRVNGVHKDPVTLARQSESVPVSLASRPQFDQVARLQLSELQAAALAPALDLE